MSDIIRLYTATNKYSCTDGAFVSVKRGDIVSTWIYPSGEFCLSPEARERYFIPPGVTHSSRVTIWLSKKVIIPMTVYSDYVLSFLDYIEGVNEDLCNDLEILRGIKL